MDTYRTEILGEVPYGLTHNEVFASFLSMMREHDSETMVTKRRLAGNRISLIVRFQSDDDFTATDAVWYAARGIPGFSFDVLPLRIVT